MALRLRSFAFAQGLRSEIREPPTYITIKSSSGMKSAGLRVGEMFLAQDDNQDPPVFCLRSGRYLPILHPILKNPFFGHRKVHEV